MNTADTSIKVPKRVRDRLQKRALRDRTTMATALERVLDESEDLAFWNRVREHNASLSEEGRASYMHDHTLRDHLSGPNDIDVSADEDW